MKRMSIPLILALAALSAGAAPITTVDVGAPAINCVFNTNCVISNLTDTTSPITLPNSTGTGFLQTRTFLGATGSVGQGLWVYEYRLDLSGITPNPGAEPCLSNVVQCVTNRVVTTSNVLGACFTNSFPASNRLVCVTNRIPATNIVFRFTNTIPATNFVNCVTNAAGGFTCVTNFFPGTNLVFTFTNRIPATNVVNCTNRLIAATNVVTCITNGMVRITNSVVNCSSNLVSCPGSTPCIDEIRLRVGTLAGLVFTNPLGATGRVYVVTSGGSGSIDPTSVDLSGGILTVRFADGVCPGESSFFFGLVSSNAPSTTQAAVELTSGATLAVSARTPVAARVPIVCDFGPLRNALNNLELSAIQAPNDNARRGRLGSLQNAARSAERAAQHGDLHGVLDALQHIAGKTGTDKNAWIRPPAASAIDDALDALLDCLDQYAKGHENGEDNQH